MTDKKRRNASNLAMPRTQSKWSSTNPPSHHQQSEVEIPWATAQVRQHHSNRKKATTIPPAPQ
jgi:hypothetical protein